MKIALVFHKSGIPGGHCEYSEVLMKGFKDIGVDAEFFYISPVVQDNHVRWVTKEQEIKRNSGKDLKGNRYTWGETIQCYYHSETGFVRKEWGYGSAHLTNKLRKRLDDFDVVIWQDIGGFKNPHNEDHKDWVNLVQRRVGQKQVVMFHDHGAFLRYPWVSKIQDQFDFMVCVHPASYNMGANFDIPRCMILNPQILDGEIVSSYKNRNLQSTMSIGAWKGSKKMHEVVKAVPWFNKDILINMCGDGTERRYLTALEKCKDAYIRTRNTDPDCTVDMLADNRNDNRFWVHANNHPGFKYWGPVDAETRDDLYRNTFMFIDPAWYSVNAKIDAHFSRVIVEAMKHGIVPFARDLGLGYGKGVGTMFITGENYINIPWNATPKQFADIVNERMSNISEDEYDSIVYNNATLVENTDHRNIAAQFVAAIEQSTEPGYYGMWERGKTNASFQAAAHSQWTGVTKGFCFNEKTI
jgi:hypothetical protein